MTAERLAAVAGRGDAHVWPVRVYYEDTDAAGIVYYANYLKFAERARTEWLRGRGLTHPMLTSDHKIAFVVRHCIADYLRAARLDDELDIHSCLIEARCASLILAQDIVRREQLIVRLRVKLACVGVNGRAARLPAAVRARLSPATADRRELVS